MAIPLLTAGSMRELDRVTIEDIGIPGPVLMEVAGRRCAEVAEELLPESGGRIAVVCGKGNNGGDGLVAARHLHHSGHQVDVFLLGDPEKLSGDARLNKEILDRIRLPVQAIEDESALSDAEFDSYDLILDAILGTGLNSKVRGLLARGIEKINQSGVLVLAVDIPSGISSDTGAVLGVAVEAVHTVTFAFPKVGQLVYPGAGHTGDLSVMDIGIPPDLAIEAPGASWLLVEDDLADYLGRRDPAAHKGHFGHLVVVAGSTDLPGAAGLCCRAAARTGAGLVTLAASEPVLSRVVSGPVEYMGRPATSLGDLKDFCQGKSAVVLGPGLGTSKQTADFVRQVVAEIELPMVVDADGLNNLAGHLEAVKQAKGPRILTPHPGEMARLLDTDTNKVQADRLKAARSLSKSLNCFVVLKGAGTIIADPEQTAFVIPSGNPGMASGGTGDVLAGIIGALLCQGLNACEAACVGAFVHGLAGDRAAGEKSQHALLASDMIEALPGVFSDFEGWHDQDDPEFDQFIP